MDSLGSEGEISMPDPIEIPNVSPDELSEGNDLLGDLIKAAKVAGGELSGGGGVDSALDDKSLDELLTAKIEFGSPYAKLKKLPVERFSEAGIKTAVEDLRGETPDAYEYYFMLMTTNFWAGSEPKHMTQLVIRFDFGPKGKAEPMVLTLLPDTKWRKVWGVGGSFKVDLKGDLTWAVDVPEKTLQLLDMEAKAALDQQGAVGGGGLIEVPEFKFDYGRFEVAASGKHNSYAGWTVANPELKQQTDADFAIVFRVPKGTKEITLEGKLFYELSTAWLEGKLSNVIQTLARRLRDLINAFLGKPEQRKRIGQRTTWTITLPEA